ncbi:nucleotidyltransferase domain-containing protein (plasmid) [Streptomyces xanthophaeus]|nr:nucleotidyltransferase domain-containing protein [Streptomyces xanthophaeus]
MLQRLDAPQEWPLHLVRQVWLFGSFARGATEPHDVDVAVRFDRDERMNQAVVQAILSGGNPYAPLRRALAGSSRGLQSCSRCGNEATHSPRPSARSTRSPRTPKPAGPSATT